MTKKEIFRRKDSATFCWRRKSCQISF